ncbi:MAG: histidine phosphatase family protein [Planctomycetota bacterium]|nr:histidine phosphatase family protein [Planctomycetota bacterium]
MKQVILLRHAKSSWEHTDLSDFERPLNRRGKRDAPRMGSWIEQQGITPDAVLCSAATRAQQTLAGLQTTTDLGEYLVVTEDLYLAPPSTTIALLTQLDDGIQTALIIAHNPGMEGLLWGLCGIDHVMPTCALAQIQLPNESWMETDLNQQGDLIELIIPRLLP